MRDRFLTFTPIVALALAFAFFLPSRPREPATALQPLVTDYCLGLIMSKQGRLIAALRDRPVLSMAEVEALSALSANGAVKTVIYFDWFGRIRWSSVAALIGLEFGALEQEGRSFRAGVAINDALQRRAPAVSRLDDTHDAIAVPFYWRGNLQGAIWVRVVRADCQLPS